MREITEDQTYIRNIKNLFVKEYPLASRYVSFADGHWWLHTIVKDLAGVGRFVIGLADQVKIVDTPALDSYLKSFVLKYILSS